jgi:hypothetical protein
VQRATNIYYCLLWWQHLPNSSWPIKSEWKVKYWREGKRKESKHHVETDEKLKLLRSCIGFHGIRLSFIKRNTLLLLSVKVCTEGPH